MGSSSLDGLRVLIVEDDALLAFDLEDLLREAGAEPIGPALTLAEAQALADRNPIDGALLDIDLGTEKVWPLAEALYARGTPFGFISAQCAIGGMPTNIGNPSCLAKPARPQAVIELVAGFMVCEEPLRVGGARG